MMYDLEYLPAARREIKNIIEYISFKLSNPIAARRLLESIEHEAENLRYAPYSMPPYRPIIETKYEYRKVLIANYIMFYRVNEIKKQITIVHIKYAKSDYGKKLKMLK